MTEQQDTKIHKIAIDDAYKENGLAKIKKAVAGNRYDPEKIVLNRFEGEILNFQAETLVDVRMGIIKKTEVGKIQGPIVAGSELAVNELVAKEYLKVRDDPGVARQIRDMFINRKDKGFALEAKIPIKFWRKSFVFYAPCSSCRSRGTQTCQRCAGRGTQSCTRCYGSGMCTCHNCNGGQMISDSNGRRQCPICNGNGKVSCPLCRQTGKIHCPACGAKGTTKCANCNGLAWISNLQEVTLEAQTKFDYPKARLPDNVVTLIERDKAKTAEHAEIHVVMQQASHVNAQDPEKIQEAEFMMKNKIFRVPILYNVILPYSHMEYEMNGKTYYTFLFGTQGMLSHVSPFLDDLLAEPLRKLQDAADGRGSVADNLKMAAKYRTAREAIILTTRHNIVKAQQMLLKHNPLGLSAEKALLLVRNADKALKDATKMPRLIGLISGQLTGLAMMGGYFLSPLREKIRLQIGNSVPGIGVDIIVAALAGYVAFTLIQAIAGKRVKALMSQIMPKQKASATLKLGTTGFYSVLLSIVAFAIVVEVSRHMNVDAPEWYENIINLIQTRIK